MRHLWGFASALGFFAFVIFATFAILSVNSNDPTAPRWMLVALGGAAVWAIGLRARGDGTAALAKVRQVIGGVGFVVAVVAWFIALLALITDPPSAPGLLTVFLVAIAAWAQGIAGQTGLSFGTALSWLVAVGLVVTAWIAMLFLVMVVLDALGLHQLVKLTAVALGTAVLGVWAWRRPDRRAASGAAARVAFGEMRTGDGALLAAGPWPLLRSPKHNGGA